jgi:hypothetical protein
MARGFGNTTLAAGTGSELILQGQPSSNRRPHERINNNILFKMGSPRYLLR